MAAVLVIAGLTGNLLAFNKELDHVFAAKLYAAPRPGVAPLDLATLMARAPVIPNARITVPNGEVAPGAVFRCVRRHVRFQWP